MLGETFMLALAASSRMLAHAKLVARQELDSTYIFNSPQLTPLLHADLLVDYPVNTTTIYGITARVANRVGMFTSFSTLRNRHGC